MGTIEELPQHVIARVEHLLENACLLTGLPLAAADALLDTLAGMLAEVAK